MILQPEPLSNSPTPKKEQLPLNQTTPLPSRTTPMPRHFEYTKLLNALSVESLTELCRNEGLDATIQKGTCSAQTQLARRLALRCNLVDGGRTLEEVGEIVKRWVEAGGGNKVKPAKAKGTGGEKGKKKKKTSK